MHRNCQKLLFLLFVIALTVQSSIHSLVNKLFDQLCPQDQKKTISLYQCESKIIQHDKKMGTYRSDQQYKMETFYMMIKYDGNKDKRLSRQEAIAMAYDIANGVVNERVVRLFWRDYQKKGDGQKDQNQGIQDDLVHQEL